MTSTRRQARVIPQKYAGVILAIGERDLCFVGAGVRFADWRGKQHGTVLLASAQSDRLVCDIQRD